MNRQATDYRLQRGMRFGLQTQDWIKLTLRRISSLLLWIIYNKNLNLT